MKKISILLTGLAFATGFGQIQNLSLNAVSSGINNYQVEGVNDILFDQSSTGENGGLSTNFTAFGGYVASADDFELTVNAKLSKITAYGFQQSGTISTELSTLRMYILADGDFIPGAVPENALYTIEVENGNPALTIADAGVFIVDLDALGLDVILPSGIYWLSVVPELPNSDGSAPLSWYWLDSTSNFNAEPHLIDPMDLFGEGWTEWTPYSVVGITNTSLGFLIEGEETTMSVSDVNGSSITVYPNPATNYVKASGEVKEMTIVNLNGQVVASSKTSSVNVSALPAGVYVVKVVDAKGKVTTSKVVKK